MTVEEMAKHIYRVMRALNLEFGVDYPEWHLATDDQKTTFIDGVQFHLDRPSIGPEETHDWWMQDKAAKGWTFGTVKDVALKQHPSMIPYKELSELERGKDVIFIEMCRIFGEMR